jgi:predicted enzyme related to lactoylglutathione lyase
MATTGTFCWSELGTTDAARARAFYTRLFGWKTADQDMGEMGTYTMLSVKDADVGGMYALQGPMFAGIPSHWMYYVSVEDVDATAAKAPRLGGKVVMPAMDIPGVGRMAVLEDPEGAKFALFQPGGHQGARANPMTPGAFCWFELHTRDPKRAATFYRGLFGWSTKVGDAGGPHEYTEWTVSGGEGPFGGMLRMNESFGDAPPFWLGYVTVEDTDAIVAAAKPLGAQVLCPPTDIEGVGRFAVLMDPTGAAFAVIRLQLDPAHKDGKGGATQQKPQQKKSAKTAKPAVKAKASAKAPAKANAKKPVAKKAPVKKAAKKAVKKAPAKKGPTKKGPAMKRPAKKAAAKKTPMRKAAAKKTPMKKAAAKKAASKANRKVAKKARR